MDHACSGDLWPAYLHMVAVAWALANACCPLLLAIAYCLLPKLVAVRFLLLHKTPRFEHGNQRVTVATVLTTMQMEIIIDPELAPPADGNVEPSPERQD